MTNEPTLIRSADAEALHDAPGSRIVLLADTAEHTINRATFSPGAAGAPAHFHTRTSETFYVLDGALDVLVDDAVHTLRSGDYLAVPPGVAHAFAPARGSGADVLVVFGTGMGRFDYYRLLDRVHRGASDPSEIASSGERFDNHYVDSPVWRSHAAPPPVRG